MSYSMLSDEDMRRIQIKGLPIQLWSELAVELENNQFQLTLKGYQYYAYALAIHGIQDARVLMVMNWLDLLKIASRVNQKVLREAEAKLAQKLASGLVPAQERARAKAILSGDLDACLQETRRLAEARLAGTNVIPIG